MLSAQCRTVKISILGDEGVPVQVDGEAWIQPPGYIRIIHKNRAQMLTRDRVGAACGTGLPCTRACASARGLGVFDVYCKPGIVFFFRCKN